MYAPILLFVYNRPEHTRRVIESLQTNVEAIESRLFIYADQARNEADRPNVNEVRRYIRSIGGFKQVTLIERSENWGLARNIIDGVSTQVNAYGRVIVLEDDLVVSPYFLRFMNDALETYKDEEQVGHIQACDFTKDPSLPDTFLIKWTGSWGWATWARAWRHFNPDGNNSWAIRWNASLFLAGILSLNVGKSLVQNTGFDGTGTNCGGGGLYASDLWMHPLPVVPISPIAENQEARRAFARYYHRTNGFWAKAIRRIKRTLRGDFGA